MAKVIIEDGVRILIANYDEGILVDGQLISQISLGKFSDPSDFEIIKLEEYNPEDYPLDIDSSLESFKEKQIKLSKNNLAKYLEDNPLLSKCKYEEGRYYNITKEKQDQLTSTLASYISDVLPTIIIGMSVGQVKVTSAEEFLLTMNNLPVTLTWNDLNNICEPYAYSELYQLKCEIFARVKPLVSVQQHIEVDIRNCTTQEEVLQVDVEFTEDNINKYMNVIGGE